MKKPSMYLEIFMAVGAGIMTWVILWFCLQGFGCKPPILWAIPSIITVPVTAILLIRVDEERNRREKIDKTDIYTKK